MISEAYISGQIHQAVFKEGDAFYLYEPFDEASERTTVIKHFDLNNFMLNRPEIDHYININWSKDELRIKLKKEIGKYDSLNLFLTGMDTSYSLNIREKAMVLLVEDCFDQQDNLMFVKNRVYGTSVPDQFNPLSAAQIARSLDYCGLMKLYEDLSYACEIIPVVRSGWKKAIVDYGIERDVIPTIEKLFVNEGIIAGFVLATLKHDVKKVDDIIVTHSQKLSNYGVNQPALFLSAIKNNIEERFSLFDKVRAKDLATNDDDIVSYKSDFVTEFNELISRFSGKKKTRNQFMKAGRKRQNSSTILSSKSLVSIENQIQRIKDLINSREDEDAKKGIIALVRFQNINSDPEHLCKSLCDIAKCYQDDRQIDLADLLARRACDLNPNDPVPQCILAENWRKSGEFSNALKAYEQIVLRFNSSITARNGKAETLRDLERYTEALEMYEHTILRFENDRFARNGMAETLRDLERFADALFVYEQTIELFGDDRIAYCGKAETLRDLGRYSEALDVYEKIVRQFEFDTYSRNGMAETLRDLGKYDEALKMYESTIQRFNDNVIAYCGKAETLRDLGKFHDALDVYENTIRRFRDNEVAFCGKAETLRDLGEFESALEIYELVANQFTHNVIARNGKAETLRDLSRYADALDEYDKIIAQFDNNLIARNGKAETLRDLGRYHEALDSYDKIIMCFRDSSIAYCGKAETLRDMEQFEQALEVYEEAIGKFAHNVIARCGKAETLKEMGELEKALGFYNEIVVVFPFNQFARASRYAVLVQLGNNLDSVYDEIKVDKPLTKNDWVIYHIQCMLLIKQNKLDAAVEKINFGLLNNTFYKEIVFFKSALSFALIKKKEYDEAIRALGAEEMSLPINQLLVAHALAASKPMSETKVRIIELMASSDLKLKRASQLLSVRYNSSDNSNHLNMTNEDLESEIESIEFSFLLPFRSSIAA